MRKYFKHKFLIFLQFVVFISFFCSCKSSKIDKSEADAKEIAVLDSLYAQEEYNIAIEVVYPFNTAATSRVANAIFRNTGDNANRIDVRGEGNFLEIQNDSVKAYLPFFGERRLGGGEYGSRNLSIQIEEPLKDLTKQINTNKSKLELEFTAQQKGNDNEEYKINIEIYPNNHVMVNITPVYRTFMRYDGRLEEMNIEEN